MPDAFVFGYFPRINSSKYYVNKYVNAKNQASMIASNDMPKLSTNIPIRTAKNTL
jgi:hypothetical protein